MFPPIKRVENTTHSVVFLTNFEVFGNQRYLLDQNYNYGENEDGTNFLCFNAMNY